VPKGKKEKELLAFWIEKLVNWWKGWRNFEEKKINPWAEDSCSEEKESCCSEGKNDWYWGWSSFNAFCCRCGRNFKGNDWIFACQAKSTKAKSDEAFQKEKEPAAAKKPTEPKKQRIIHVVEVIEQTPPSTSKTPAVESTDAAEAIAIEADTADAEAAEDTNLETTLSVIDNILLNEPAEEAARAAKETLATAPGKGKEKAKETSEEEDFNFQDILGQELSKAEKEELKEYAMSCGYRPGALLFGGVDEESLGCLRDRTRAKIVGTLSKSVGLPKVEADLSRYRRQHIAGSLFYTNFMVKFLAFYYFDMKIVFWWSLFYQSLLLSKVLRMQQDLEDKKNEVIIEGLEKKIKDHEAALEKKDFVLQTMEGSLAEA
jgi:hypothetical protein